MYPKIVECFMCTNDNKCSVVNNKIVTQVEYLLPEITIVKRGIPLRICSICEQNLQSFSKFKDVCVENNLRLEARLKEAQDSTNNMAQSCKAVDFEFLIDSAKNKNEQSRSRDYKFEDIPLLERIIRIALCSNGSGTKAFSALNTQLHTNSATIDNTFEDTVFIEKIKKLINRIIIENKFATVNKNTKNIEGISTNEELCEKTMHDHEFYNYLVQNTVEEKSIRDYNINCSKDNQISAEVKNIPAASNIQKFQIFLPPEEKNREAQRRKENATHTYDSMEIHLHRDRVDMTDTDTSHQNDNSEISSEKFEEIYIKEELPEEIFVDSHDYDNENTTKEEFIIDNNVNAPKTDNEKKGFQCTLCLQIFVRKCALVSHVKAHNRPKYVKCNECNKYIEKKVLSSHIQTHSEEKKSYFLEQDLDLDMKFHERKEFPCPTCNKVFKLKSGLKTHVKIHTGVKDFKCHVCNKLFNQKGNMQAHLKLHNKYPQ